MRILSLSGFVPEHFCDTVRFAGYFGDRNISHYCGYASDFISQTLYDDSIDGAVFPKSCDSSRVMQAYLKNSGKFLYQFPVPARCDEAGRDFFASVLKDFERKLHEYYGTADIDVVKRIEAIGRRNAAIRKVYEGVEYKSFYDLLHSVHVMLSKPLFEQSIDAANIRLRQPTPKRVYVIGSFLSNDNIVKIMEDSGLTIVGDDLPEMGRLISSSEVSMDGDIYRNIAESILSARKSPTQDDFQDICSRDIQEIQRRGAKGVIFVTQKYCEPYDYLFYRFKKPLEDLGIPAVSIVLSDSLDEGKSRLAIEAFADMI